jgi:hypothetical protein
MSRQKGKQIGEGMVYRQWARARQAARLPTELVLYCARHDFGSFVLARTGSLKAVMNTMGHGDVRSAMIYQHPEGEIIRNALDARHLSGPTVALAIMCSLTLGGRSGRESCVEMCRCTIQLAPQNMRLTTN